MKEKTTHASLVKKILKKKRLYSGAYVTLDRFSVGLPDGCKGEREAVTVKDAVAVLLLEEDGTVHLVRQHRSVIDRVLVEVPAGLIDGNETPEEAARRECEEETGYRPGRLRQLLHYAHAEGYSTGFTTLFLGTDLKHTGRIQFDSSELLEQVSMSLDDLIRMIDHNKILDSKTMLCAFLVKKRLGV